MSKPQFDPTQTPTTKALPMSDIENGRPPEDGHAPFDEPTNGLVKIDGDDSLQAQAIYTPEMKERMLQHFEYHHLPEELAEISRPFNRLAFDIATIITAGPERTVALRKLLEAKDAAVRAKRLPGC